MKLNEMPDSFWSDTREDSIERKKIEPLLKEFNKTYASSGRQHRLYALTLTARESFVREQGVWFNDDARERLISDLYHQLEHRLSSHAQKNYCRPIHDSKRMFSLGFIEHISKETKKRVSPHLHATIAIHNDWHDKILECFERNLCREHYSMRPGIFSGSAWREFEKKIGSIRLENCYGLYRWNCYSGKSLDEEYQSCGVMTTGIAA